MHRPLLVRGARQLLTLRGAEAPRRGAASLELGIISDGSVLIREARIVSVGPSRRVDNLAEARNAVVHEAHGAVVMPGFVDAQVALPENGAVLRRLLELAFAHGSTTVGGSASYPVLRALAAGNPARAQLIAALDVSGTFDEAQVGRAVRRGLARSLRIDLNAQSRAALHLFRELGSAIRAYAADPANPDWLGLALAYGAATVEVGAPLDTAQIALLADAPVCAVVTPDAAPVARQLMRHYGAVALGTGFDATAPGTCSMQAAVVRAAREGGLDIAEAITMATINAGCALGAGAECGSLEAGKRANLLILRVPDYRELIHYEGANVVANIFQAGTLVK